ncbi:MAG TPA: hypothetical protein VGC54_01430 [Planctomycetota bacterium]
MNTSKLLALAVALGSVLALWLGLFPSNQPLGAAGNGLTLLVDSDGDGLDDVLEARIGLSRDMRDSDGDLIDDAVELLVGTDPSTANVLPAMPSAHMAVEVYALNNSAVLQIYFLYETSIDRFSLLMGNRARTVEFDSKDLRPFRAKARDIHTPWPGWRLRAVSFRLPRALIEENDALTIGVRGLVDGNRVSDHIVLMQVSSGSRSGTPVLAELRMGVGSGGQGATASGGNNPFLNFGSGLGTGEASGGNGGLFPVDPTDGGSGTGAEADFVCYQVLEPIASLGGSRMLYRVVQATCEPMAGAVCIAGCQLAVGRTIIGFDPAGLIGG